MKKLILALIFGLSIAHAGQERGNGGDAVVCYNPGYKDAVVRDPKQIVSVELLDLYEGRVFKNMTYTFSLATDFLAVAKEQIEKLKVLSPLRHFLFSKDLAAFEDDTVFLAGTQLQDVDDSAHIAIPVNCKIEQLVIQKNPEFPGDKRYSIDGDLWNKMDAANRSATITHELFYKEMSPMAQNSRGVRHINALLNSKNFLSMTTNLWFVHQHFVKTMYVEFDGLALSRWWVGFPRSEIPGEQYNNDWILYSTLASQHSDYFDKIGFKPNPIGKVFGKDFSKFDGLSVWAKCDFSTCQFANITATSLNGIKNPNSFFNLNLPESVLLNTVYFDQSGLAKKATVSSEGTEILLVLKNYTLNNNTKSADLVISNSGQWTINNGSFPVTPILQQKMNFTRYPGTINIQLESGELKVAYENGPVLAIKLKMDGAPKETFVIGESGQIESIILRGLQYQPSDKSQDLFFADGSTRRVCEGEKINFDGNLRVVMNPQWKLLKASYKDIPDCFGTPR